MVLLYELLDRPDWFTTPTHLVAITTGVMGTLLAFRTNQSYDRFWEGRKQWSALSSLIRNSARLIWINVDESTALARAQKVAALKLCTGLAFAVKHELRGEHGLFYQDLHGLLPGIETTCFPKRKQRPLNSACSLPSAPIRETQPLLPASLPNFAERHHIDFRCGCTSIPLTVINQLSVFNASKLKKDEISPAMSASLHAQINAIVDAVTGMERILATRIPHAYGLHLRQVLVIYCLFLPMQIMASLGWYTGPCLMLVSFVLFGIENLGLEIENPFGYDPNDLPLDRYCEATKREIEDLIRTRRPETLEDGIFDYQAFLKDIQDDIAGEKFVTETAEIPTAVSQN
ncbi:hypothetical protein HDU97_001687 [Phlyctochytrium planicorne]|nr:hypothetical protein HDU97_001687 [Phlyctochytrium planicorne]